jgi:tRNA nucleotidyltransferase (CCA-adding enzyme)
MASLISQYLIDQYAAGPSYTRVAAVKSLHEDVRKALAEAAGSKFDTFLQGSYRNNTAIADINDVDIVALYDPWTVPVSHSGWQSLFESVASILRGSWRVSGSVMIADKCVKLVGNLKADIVPAVSRTSYSSSDPIHIYSRSNSQERPNFPRTHYQNGALKQAATDDTYKATVRLFKRWVRQYRDLRRFTSNVPFTASLTPSSTPTCRSPS